MMKIHASTWLALHGGKIAGRVTFGVPDDYAMSDLAPRAADLCQPVQ
jgi:hypothetical protein